MFTEKLNKKTDGSVYVIEEEQLIASGKYEGYLNHDNVNVNTIKVFTGSKFTGNEIIDVIKSKPADTPWKTHIKIFSNDGKVFITYETPGDTVEADDINDMQEKNEELREDFEQYSTENNAVVLDLNTRVSIVETAKATITYVDTELIKKADKSSIYTKTETDQRIQAVVSAAPEALDTLKEIADALNNDPDFAGTMTMQLAGKVDKVVGKGLSTEDYTSEEKSKLAGIEAGANNYKLPTTLPASMISGLPTSLPANGGNADTVGGKTVAENVPAGAKFTDTTYGVATTFANGLMSSSDKTKLNGIAEGANNYSHPSNHPPSIISQDANNRFVTDAEKSNWNGKAAGSHSHPASQVTAGTLPVGVKATDSTDYTTSRVRNARFGTTEPTSLANGEIYFMYE